MPCPRTIVHRWCSYHWITVCVFVWIVLSLVLITSTSDWCVGELFKAHPDHPPVHVFSNYMYKKFQWVQFPLFSCLLLTIAQKRGSKAKYSRIGSSCKVPERLCCLAPPPGKVCYYCNHPGSWLKSSLTSSRKHWALAILIKPSNSHFWLNVPPGHIHWSLWCSSEVVGQGIQNPLS